MVSRSARLIAAAVLACAGVMGLPRVATAQAAPTSYKESPFLRIDPDRILVSDSRGQAPCGECHRSEWAAWSETRHATGFESMHRTESAQDILTNMEMSVTKRQEALCMRCHYTVGPNRRAVAGVSCESCHGPARDWIGVHNTWGDGAADRRQEQAAARERRLAESRAAGMLRPSTDLYGVAANCYECHTVPMEELVNKGGHKAGTSGFDLVKRMNSIRHNFLGATAGDMTANRALSAERMRVMLVVGRMLAYEYSLRGMAAATAAGPYSRAMERRVKDAWRQLDEIATAVPAVADALRAGANARLVPGNAVELESIATAIRAIGERFVASESGASLAALDPVLAGEPLTRATTIASVPVAAVAPAGSGAAASRAAVPAESAAARTKTVTPPADTRATPATSVTPVASAAAAAPVLPGAVRSRPAWHTGEGRSGMADAGECAACHGDSEAAMADGPHQRAAQRLRGENAKARQIAELYGIGAAGMARADRICMSCHATVDQATGAAHEDGVTCEGCHGAGATYLESHKKGGNQQPGMRNLKQASVRAALCADCHRISDERLLAAGHPDGTNKDIVAANNRLKHWPSTKPERARQRRGESYAAVSDDALRSAYGTVAGARAIPKVTVVVPPTPPRRAAVAPATGTLPSVASATTPATAVTGLSSAPATRTTTRTAVSSVPPAVPAPVARPATTDVTLQLAPLPSLDSLTTEALLALVQQRVARVHAAIRRANPQP